MLVYIADLEAAVASYREHEGDDNTVATLDVFIHGERRVVVVQERESER